MTGLRGWSLLVLLTVLSDAQQLNGPIITSPKEILLKKGDNYTIYCKGKRPLEFKQQEMAEEVTGNFTKTQRNVAPSDAEYSYEIALDLYSVDQFAVGYYACLDDGGAAPSGLDAEPADSPHVSYTYVYVNDDELIVPMREILFVRPGSTIVIECKPTYPDVEISLTMNSEQKGNKKPEIQVLRNSTKIGFFVKVSKTDKYVCEGRRGNKYQNKSAHIYYRYKTPNDVDSKVRLKIQAQKYFLEGETVILNCTIPYSSYETSTRAVSLQWVIPRGNFINVDTLSNENETISNTLFRAIRINNATKSDEGLYTCSADMNVKPRQDKNATLHFLPAPILKLKKGELINAESRGGRDFKFVFEILEQHPLAHVEIFKDGHIPIKNSSKYEITRTTIKKDVEILIRDLTVEDIGNYTLEAKNANETKTSTHQLVLLDQPRITFKMSNERKLKGVEAILSCEVTGYPIPTVQWIFIDDETQNETDPIDGDIQELTIYKLVSKLKIPVTTSGTIICKASNSQNVSNVTKEFRVDEIPNGFGIENNVNGTKWASQNGNVVLRCLASKYDYTFVDWLKPNNSKSPNMAVEYSSNSMSQIATLKIDQIALNQSGDYTCVGYNQTSEKRRETVSIQVKAILPLSIEDFGLDEIKEVHYNQPVELVCTAEAVPPPSITWYKNNEIVNDHIITSTFNFTKVQSVYTYTKNNDTVDEFHCVAENINSKLEKHFSVSFPKPLFRSEYLGIIGAIILALIVLVVYLTWKIKKEKQFRKELNAAGLLYFKEGAVKSLNPNLPIDEQADLLPYNDKFEFPADKLVLGPQLGAGAFGVVYRAEARGILNAEVTTTVAVKMVKKTADNIYIKALASELKIMANLGQHINIVNLLGACTKNVAKRELSVIVEYCKFGNIHNYMQRHREVFIDQLTDNKEKHQGTVNRAFSYSSGNSGMNSDCFNSNQTQHTDHTFLSTAASSRPGRIVSESGYVQPEWRSNYESDYAYNGRQPRPLTSRDLLAWAFQISRGMEYLASRKILHGDLAARNILLAENNVVKICDFGLARSIYKNDEYQKKENSPLPIKWLALECITDRIFSTQSDVWSFGIVLWELFSLAKTPYPEISPQELPLRLQQGHRMGKPMYADDRLYDVMRSCWEQRPPKRPSFTELQKTIGSFLEDNVRDHYVELNAICETTNADNTGEDYLMRVCAPDFNVQVTPSPHHYTNDADGFFFGSNPSKLQNDDDGYLAMTPASNQNIRSPRHGTAFDFEARALNTRGSATSQGCELTPMLTLNHIPRSGSESDQEGSTSPYLNMQPRIDEETDERRRRRPRWRYRHT